MNASDASVFHLAATRNASANDDQQVSGTGRLIIGIVVSFVRGVSFVDGLSSPIGVLDHYSPQRDWQCHGSDSDLSRATSPASD